jgi:hypothetical protein
MPICIYFKSILILFAPLLEQAFSRSWLLLKLTGTNWGVTGDSEKTQKRQTENQVFWELGWRCTTLIASFLYYSFYSASIFIL